MVRIVQCGILPFNNLWIKVYQHYGPPVLDCPAYIYIVSSSHRYTIGSAAKVLYPAAGKEQSSN